jgi:peptide/nickel transport system substrate-binding protein
VFAVLAIVLAACGSDSNKSSKSSSGGSTGAVPTGGTLVVGAEQEPDCADWIASCAGASWGLYTIQEHTMPRTFDFVKKNGTWVETPNILLAGEPTRATVAGKQTVTYKINPDAKWSDGQPITSTDFKYSWDQIANGDDIYDKTGYNQIESVNDTDPKTAVVTFTSPYAGWKQLWGAFYGVMPSHILQGQDRSAAMANGYDWSGGPWIAKWDKGVEVTLTQNPNWYGTKAKLDKVIFKFQADTSAEFQAFKNGETKAIYPQPQLDAVQQIKAGIPGANSFFTADTANVEALWMNNEKPPFDSVPVRQAFAYALDRNAIVKKLFGGLGVDKAVNTINPPILSAYSDPNAWAGYNKNLTKVTSLMKGDGWAKGSDGIWAKNGQKATFEIKSTTGNKRRELTEQILQEQLKAAGFGLTIANQEAGDLFGTILPAGTTCCRSTRRWPRASSPVSARSSVRPTSRPQPTATRVRTGSGWTPRRTRRCCRSTPTSTTRFACPRPRRPTGSWPPTRCRCRSTRSPTCSCGARRSSDRSTTTRSSGCSATSTSGVWRSSK